MAFLVSFYFINLKLARFFLAPVLALLYRSRGKPLPKIKYGWLKMSATDLAEKIRNKEITSVGLMRLFLERIQEVNPQINAVVDSRIEDALEDAKEADKLVAEKSTKELLEKYPLLGVPFTAKEIIAVKGLRLACGVKARGGVKADEDAEVIRLLRVAGAIPICVTNVPEFCMSWETAGKLSGKVANPYNLGRTAGGSSGGEAAILASGGSAFGIATDMGGSIRMPAQHCGIFGHKPTSGLISLEGIYPEPDDKLFRSYNTIGVMARHAKDLRTCLRIISEDNPHLGLKDEVNVQDIKIYFKKEFESYFMQGVGVHKSIKNVMNDALEFFRSNGNFVDDCTINMKEIPHIGSLLFMGIDVPDLMACMKEKGKRDSVVWESFKCLAGQSNYSFNALSLVAAYRMRVLFPKSMFEEYQKKLRTIRKEFMKLFDENAVLLLPSFPVPAFHHYGSLPLMNGVAYSQCFNLLGFPSTQVPMGLNKDGLPVGFQVISGPFQDKLCLAVALELEKKFGGWVPPS